MVRGTTPIHTFELPFDTAMIKTLEICYAQDRTVILTKTAEDCTLSENTITVPFTQEDTFKFADDKKAEVQIRVLTLGGEVIASFPQRVVVHGSLSDEVLV